MKNIIKALHDSILHYEDALGLDETNWKTFDDTKEACALCNLVEPLKNTCKDCPITENINGHYTCSSEWKRLNTALMNNDFVGFRKNVKDMLKKLNHILKNMLGIILND